MAPGPKLPWKYENSQNRENPDTGVMFVISIKAYGKTTHICKISGDITSKSMILTTGNSRRRVGQASDGSSHLLLSSIGTLAALGSTSPPASEAVLGRIPLVASKPTVTTTKNLKHSISIKIYLILGTNCKITNSNI